MNSEIKERLLYVEDRDIIIKPNNYYHGTRYSIYALEKIENMLLKGIKCPISMLKKGGPYNGLFYISVSDYSKGYDYINSAYNSHLEKDLMFILSDKLPVIKTRDYYPFFNNLVGGMCSNTPIPYRISSFEDEAQVFGYISPKYYEGLEYYIKAMIERKYYDEASQIDIYNSLYYLVDLLKDLNMDLPIYDYSTKKEINKEKVLELKLIK